MLVRLSISNIVLIERLDLEFGPGLTVLTGETGAGKSILMDALALALGARSDAGLVRTGCDRATVVAEFDDTDDVLKSFLDENEIEYDNSLILRRTLSPDGKSRAWINDIPVSIKTLKHVGDALVEIHGQFANHTLLDPSTHRASLDTYGIMHNAEYEQFLRATNTAYNTYNNAKKHLDELQKISEKSESERDFLTHNFNELSALNVRIGEESELAEKRAAIMNAEKNSAILSDAISALNPNGTSLDSQIYSVAHILQRIKTEPNPYSEQIDALYDIAQQLSDISEQITPSDTDTDDIDSIEERLFAIRAAARKHRVPADELPRILNELSEQLNTIENSDAEIKRAEQELSIKESEYRNAAQKLTHARCAAAKSLRERILAELPDLKLGASDFMVSRTESAPSGHGCDDIIFMIKTNPGMPFAPINRAASGGELARFMLALRVVLANGGTAHTFVFDEIDTGISGATASAVGNRLNRLAQSSQTLVITHSAQVAGYADKHFKISKHTANDTTTTDVTEIRGDERINEIARIISGAKITPESLATARTLIKN